MNTGSGSSTNAKILQLAICLDYLRFNCVKSSEDVALNYQIGQCDVTEEANIRWPPLSDMILRFRRCFCVRRETCLAFTGENVWLRSALWHIEALLPLKRFMPFSLLHSPASMCCIIHKWTWNHVMSRALFCWTHALRYLGNLTLFILKRGN